MSDDPTGVPAGWFPDPYGRYVQRYWDGGRWTEHVATGGVQATDPMGASPVIPIATPATQWQPPTSGGVAAAGGPPPPSPAGADDPTAGNTVTAPGPVERMLDGMGDDARTRPRPALTTALAGIGGAVVSFGVVVLFAGEDGSRSGVGVASALLLLMAYLVRAFTPPTELHAAAIGAAALSIGFLAFAITIGDDGLGGTATGLLLAVLYLAAWALPGFRGRTLFLGLGAVSLIAALGSLTAPDPSDEFIDSTLPSSLTSVVGDQGVVLLIGAALCLALTWWLDRKGYAGTATGLVAAGLGAAAGGTVLLAQRFSGSGAAALVLVVGVLVCVVGSHGARRATTWAGAALAAGGLVALIGVSVDPESSGAVGATVMVAGAILVGGAMAVGRVRAARSHEAGAPPPA